MNAFDFRVTSMTASRQDSMHPLIMDIENRFSTFAVTWNVCGRAKLFRMVNCCVSVVRISKVSAVGNTAHVPYDMGR